MHFFLKLEDTYVDMSTQLMYRYQKYSADISRAGAHLSPHLMDDFPVVIGWAFREVAAFFSPSTPPVYLWAAGVIAELPSLPIYREISRKYSKINPISRSPAFYLQSPAKESFCCIFYAYFSICICRRTVLPVVSHLCTRKVPRAAKRRLYKTHIIELF